MDASSAWDDAVPVGAKAQPDVDAAWDAAAPVKLPKAAPKARDPNPTSAKNIAGAATEPLLSMGTGAVAGPLSGLAGIAGTMLPGPPGQGAKWQEKVGHGMTYAPRTTGGQNAMGAIAYPFEKIGQGADYAGGKVAEGTGSPAAGAGVNAFLQLLPQLLGAKGMRAGAGAVDRATGAMKEYLPELGGSPLPKPPGIDPNVKTLMDRGIPVTPGEIKGGKWKRAEEALESVPIAGAPVKAARGRGVEAFNETAVNDALKPVGEKLPKGMKGNEAITWAREKLGDKYEELLPKMRGELDNAAPKGALPAPGQLGQPPKPTFREELEKLRAMGDELGDAQKAGLNRIIDKEVIAKFTKQGKADGQTLKNIESRLSDIAKGMGKSDDYQVRDLGLAVKEIQSSMRRMVEDVNPKHGTELQAINQGYAKFKIAQQAAAAPGAKEGMFTPPQYDRAVRNKDSSKDKRAYSEGTANQQDLSGAGKSVLGNSLPDSGTPFRLAMMKMLADPKAMGITLAGGIPSALLYSPMGIQLMQRLLTNPPAAGRAGAMAAPFGAAQAGGQLPPPPQ